MRRLIFAWCLILICVPLISPNAQPTLGSAPNQKVVMSNLSSMPLSFTENRGQWDEKALFKAEAGGATFWFCKDEVIYQFLRDTKEVIDDGMPKMPGLLEGMPDKFNHPRYKKESMVLRAQFVGANLNPEISGADRLSHNNNYFLGNIPSKWATDVPNFSSITYKEIYPGIDLKYHGDGKGMKYDFIVNPGADISQIKIKYEGVDGLDVTSIGDLQATTRFGNVYERIPQIYQIINGQKREISGHYILKDPSVFGFVLEDDFNPAYPIIIDPELVYSTYLGGSADDGSSAIAVDNYGDIFVTGNTSSTDFPLINPFDNTNENGDIFITKFSPAGNDIIFSTYLGGNGGDGASSIAIDESGNVYLTGATFSTDFPTVNPFQALISTPPDAFVTKLSTSGNALLYSTYFGGSKDGGHQETAFGIAVDNQGEAYITGYTDSPDFPLANPIDSICDCGGSLDAFVSKFTASGNSLIFSTYLGGIGRDHAYGIAVDQFGNAYVTGNTTGDFPIVNAYQSQIIGPPDIYVTKLSSTGESIIFSTYVGGNGEDMAYGIAVDNNNNTVVAGFTASSPDTTGGGFPVISAFDSCYNGNYDAIVFKLSAGGNSLLYSNYLGGSERDEGRAIAVDNAGNAYITGVTFSADYPFIDGFDNNYNGGLDAIVAKISSSGTSLLYSTFLGGGGDDNGAGISTDISGNVCISGSTMSSNFPTQNPLDGNLSGSSDVFISKFQVSLPHDVYPAQIIRPAAYELTGIPFMPQVSVYNSGQNTESFPVIMNIYNLAGTQVYSSSTNTNNLPSLRADTAIFDPCTLSINGVYSCSVYTFLTTDMNPSNDKIWKAFPVYQYEGAIQGSVRRLSSDPIAGVIVTDSIDNIIDTTNVDGGYILFGLRSGNHDIHFSHPQYQDTMLSQIVVAPHDTTILNVNLIPLQFSAILWFGNSDGSPIDAAIGSRVNVDLFVQTSGPLYLGRIHIPLAVNGLYLDSLLSQSDGEYYYPLTEWDTTQYLPPTGSPPNPQGWRSQSFTGVANPGGQGNPWLHYEAPTRILTFATHTIFNPELMNDTIQCLNTGVHPQFGGLSLFDTLGNQVQDVIVSFSPIHFMPSVDYGYIAGRVRNSYSQGLNNVQITAVGPTNGQYVTDDYGYYLIPYLYHGQYNLTFSSPQYHDTTITNISVTGLDTTVMDVIMRFESPPNVIFWIGNLGGSPITARIGGPLYIDVYAMTTQTTYGGGIHFPLGLLNSCFDSLMSLNRGQYFYPFTQWDLAEYQDPNGSPPNPAGWSSQSFLGWGDLSGGPNPWFHLETPTKILSFVAGVVNVDSLSGKTIDCLQIGQHPTLGGLSVTDTLEGFSFSSYVFISPVTFEAAPDNEYLPGDVNMYNGNWPPSIIGSDLTYLVNFFIGNLSIEPCMLRGFWASADANGDCLVNGGDVTKLVNYFRGIGSMRYCPDHEPLWHNPGEIPAQPPPGWPNCHEVLLYDNPLNGSNEGGR
jgi:hypothetical protein